MNFGRKPEIPLVIFFINHVNQSLTANSKLTTLYYINTKVILPSIQQCSATLWQTTA